MALSARERLKRFYAVFKGDDQVLIAINADPDAIASAMGVKRLLWRKVSGTVIANINIIKRPDNLAMIRLLGIGLTPFKEIDLNRFSRIVMVDSQPGHSSAFYGLVPHVIIDHHPITTAPNGFHDIRPDFGATATIVTEYLRAARIKPSVKLATGLFHAIKTDTSNFERPSRIEDMRAFQFLFRYANLNLAQKIEQGMIRLDFLKYFQIALTAKRIRKGRLFVHLGLVVSPDVCVLIADFFLRIDQVNYTIVSGICDGTLSIIFRNDGLRADAGKLAKRGFGRFGSAGGHKSMARADIRLSDLPSALDVKKDTAVSKWIKQQIIPRTGAQKRPSKTGCTEKSKLDE